jgi:hypothetical protein
METNLQKIPKNANVKRRLASQKECLLDMKDTLPKLFKAFEDACLDYNEVMRTVPPNSRGRGFEASVFNTMFIKAIQSHFPRNWRFGKYKRFILYKDGYLILPKKLNNKGMPMNIKTKMVESINFQLTGSLFEEAGYVEDPILYFGYKRDKIGELHSPQLLYIDENQRRWVIEESELALSGSNKVKSIQKVKAPTVKATPKLKASKKKASNE